MAARLQGTNAQLIEADAVRVWSIVEDAGRLPEWVPVVSDVVQAGAREKQGSVRRCNVEMGRKRGYIVERCVEAVPERRLSHAVDDDSLGFSKLFESYSFALSLGPDPRGTLVTCETYYEPRGPLSRIMNVLVMRRKFDGVRRELLYGLKRLA